jgi:radical SAM superfamily enzyme YgiQ (UPF0313 family)
MSNTRLPASLSDEIGCVMPLGIAHIAAYLKSKNIDVSILDADAENLSLEETEQRIREINPDIVGITSMTPTIHDDLEVARIAKKLGCIVVMGGPHINAMPEETMEFDFIDFAIRGEGEIPMFNLIEALKKEKSFEEVPGLIYRDENHKTIMNPPYIHQSLDELPFPARDLLPYEKYFSLISKGRLTTVCAGRGCPFTCGFCFKQPSDKKCRFRSPKSVADEIQEVISKYGIEEVNFVTDTLTLEKSFIEGFCNEIIQRNIKISWIAPTRVDCIDPELIKLMKKAGCRSLRFGVESGSSEILKLMNKKIDLEQAIKVFKWAKQEKIETFAYMIIGYLNETEETVKQTLKFVKKLKPDLLMYNVATPLPCTKLFEQAIEAGVIEKDYWQKFLKDKNYPRIPYLFKDTEKWIDKAYKEFFFSPSFVIKKMLQIRPDNILLYLKAFKGIMGLKK